MGKGDRSLILFKSGEHLQENVLDKVLLRDAAREVGTHDANDQGMEVLHKLPSRRLIALAYAIEAVNHVERLVVRH
jgi:hypothetical protein